MDKQVTPIQKAIEWCTNKQEGEHTHYTPEQMHSLELFIEKLESLLPEEKLFAGGAWADGYVHGGSDFMDIERGTSPVFGEGNFNDFYKQFEDEK